MLIVNHFGSIVNDECRLWVDHHLAAVDFAEAILVDLPVAADNGVLAVGDADFSCLAIGIEDDDNVVPRIASSMVLKLETYKAGRRGKELQMVAHKFGFAESEGGMVLTQLDETLVIFEHLRIALQVVPIEMVHRVGRLKRVVHALLVSQHLFTSEHERNAL